MSQEFMMARRGVMGVLGGAVVAVLGGCRIFGGGSGYRFRMTVEVETPQGLKTGSSVYQVTAGYRPDLQPGGKAREWAARGEAVAVDLPGGKTLFALLKTDAIHGDLVGMSMKALDPAFKNDIPECAKRIAGGDGTRTQADVLPSDYPMLVTFRDINDPKSVTLVKANDLAASFGPGVQLKRIAVEVTDDAVTTGIEEKLGWLGDVGKTRSTLIPNPPRLLKDASEIQLLDPSAFGTELKLR